MVCKIPDFQRSRYHRAGVKLLREGWLKYPNSVPVPECFIALELQDGFFLVFSRGNGEMGISYNWCWWDCLLVFSIIAGKVKAFAFPLWPGCQ